MTENSNVSNPQGSQENESTAKRKRGFACLSPEARREIARKGGATAQKKGVAHRFTSQEAHSAGKKGGRIISMDRSYMASIGRKGGRAAAKAREDEAREQ